MKLTKPCPSPGCPELVERGRCATHRRAAERTRGTPAARGYNTRHAAFRRAVLRRDPMCVLCHTKPSEHADHWPLSLRDLLQDQHLNPYDPARGRGLCHPCHSRETTQHQPGGWNAR